MVLADFGAEVIWLDTDSEVGSYRVWQRGKQRLAVDAGEDAERIRALVVESADVFLTSLASAELEASGLAYTTLSRDRPNLIMAHVTGCGRHPTFSELPIHEGLAAAVMGRMMVFEGVAARAGPVYPALQVATHATAQASVAAILSAVLDRDNRNVGRLIETDLLHGLLPYEMNQLLVQQLVDRGALPDRQIDPHSFMPSINYHPVLAADGQWLQLGNLLPHLLLNFLDTAELDEITQDASFAQLPWSRETVERYRALLLAHMRQDTAANWMQKFVDHGGVVAHAYQSTQAAMQDPDVVANGHAVEAHGFTQLGLVARLTETPGAVAAPSATVEWENLAPHAVIADGEIAKRLPLEGVTIVECATIIAAPLGTSMLADLGARVIKIEPLAGDPFRGMGGGTGAARCNTGKESVCLDLKQAEARAALEDIVAAADVLVHNYRPGVPERLGLDYATLQRRNPRLVYLSVNGYGPDGPGARRPSTHPIPGAALGGVSYQLGETLGAGGGIDEIRETARRLFRANEVNPDPNTSMVVATTVLLGLRARSRLGVGQAMFTDMFGANAYANFDDFVAADVSARPPLDHGLYGVGPLARLYACADGWVFVYVADDSNWQALAKWLNSDLLERFTSVEAALQQEGSLVMALEEAFARVSAERAEVELIDKGVGCVRADRPLPGAGLAHDLLLREAGLVVATEHPEYGQILRHAPVVRLREASEFLGPCRAGDSTAKILAEFCSKRRAQEMIRAGAALDARVED